MPKAQVMVVEDEVIVARDIEARLKRLGYGVVGVVSSGKRALEAVAKAHPDVVLMDVMLRGAMDGVAAADVIRHRFDIPVVYLTAYSDDQTLQRAKVSEPYGYILKPFTERELHTTLEMALYRHQMEKRLRERERWLATTLKSIGDAIITTDTAGHVTFLNPVAENLTGWKQEEALGRDVAEVFNIINERTRSTSGSPVARVLRSGAIAGLENHTTLISKHGKEMPVDDSAAPIRHDDGELAGVVLVFRDVSERRTTQLLQSSLGFLQSTLNALSAHIAVLDDSGTIVAVNEAWRRFAVDNHLGAPAFGVGSNYLEVCDSVCDGQEDDALAVAAGIREVIANQREDFYREYPCHTFDEQRWFGVHVTRFEGDGSVRVVVAHQDITEQKRAAEALKESEKHFRSLIENGLDFITILAEDGTVRYQSPSIERLLGYAAGKVLNRHISEFVHPDDLPQVEQAIKRALQERGASVSTELRLRHRGGSWRVFEAIGSSSVDDSGEVRVIINSRDITDRKDAESELGARARQQAAVAQLGQQALTCSDVLALLEEAAALVGRTLDVEYSMVLQLSADGNVFQLRAGTGWPEGLVGAARVSAKTDSHAGQALLSREPVVVESLSTETQLKGDQLLRDYGVVSGMCVLIPGQHRPFGALCAYTTRPRSFSRNDTHFLESVSNVLAGAIERTGVEEERKALEEQLFQAQKMESLGTLAGGIAHDFNNLLTSIMGFAELAQGELNPGSRPHQDIATIRSQGARAADLIKQLLTFSRRAPTERQPLDLQPLLKETLRMLQRMLPENILLKLFLPEQRVIVNADPTQMQQIIVNLSTNARDAMPAGGELTIELSCDLLDEEYCRRHSNVAPGNYVCLAVRDTGLGMSDEVQDRIFEPFFSTKGRGEGTGLGLSVVYGIVRIHGGHITSFSEVGKGTEFRVYLPAMEVSATYADTPMIDSPLGKGETILLVEDDLIVLSIAQRMLERLGYVVLRASNGEEGLELYRAHGEDIALVVTDMVMPRMGGEEFLSQLTQINPGLKAVLVSGYRVKQEVAQLRQDGVSGFVAKPFTLDKLGQAVRHALDER